jgi:DNA polymerase-3 subunit epsilon
MRASVAQLIASELGLTRPLAVIDVESTGPAPDADRIIELAVLKVHPGGALTQGVMRFNPTVPIPSEATEVHGIADADVASCTTFASKAAAIARTLAECDLAGHNIRGYDIRILVAEFRRAGVETPWADARIIDTKAIFFRQEPRDLNAAVAYYVGVEAAERHAQVAHGALADVEATVEVLAGQLLRYGELPRSLDDLHTFCVNRKPGAVDEEGKFYWRNGEATLSFGKHVGRSLRELVEQQPDYLRWMLGQDFPLDTRNIIADALFAGRFPARPLPEAA